MKCNSCQVVAINGLACHETGCPDAWRTARRECRECGRLFVPDSRGQWECDEDCFAAYRGWTAAGMNWDES